MMHREKGCETPYVDTLRRNENTEHPTRLLLGEGAGSGERLAGVADGSDWVRPARPLVSPETSSKPRESVDEGPIVADTERKRPSRDEEGRFLPVPNPRFEPGAGPRGWCQLCGAPSDVHVTYEALTEAGGVRSIGVTVSARRPTGRLLELCGGCAQCLAALAGWVGHPLQWCPTCKSRRLDARTGRCGWCRNVLPPRQRIGRPVPVRGNGSIVAIDATDAAATPKGAA